MKHNDQFDHKWSQASKKDKTEESYVFVPTGSRPVTQRQLFLYQYYTLIKGKMMQGVGAVQSQKVLEMGCGRGTVSLYFALYDSCFVSLCDVSRPAVELAKENFIHFGAQGTIEESAAEHTPFATSEFDLVFSIGLLEHLEDYQAIVDEKFRVVRSGGMVASLNIPQKQSIQILNTWYRKILTFFGQQDTLKPDYYRNAQTPEMYRDAFVRAGFVDCTIVSVTPFPIFTPLPVLLEHGMTYFYRSLLVIRGFFLTHPFVTNRKVGQAHFIFAKKP